MAQALADRIVEAFAEYLHQRIRKDIWGYNAEEALDTESMLKIKYQGIRPAPGYPSQPDHTEKSTMWECCKAHELAGIELSSSLSMMPAASVSALVFAHPESEYVRAAAHPPELLSETACFPPLKGLPSQSEPASAAEGHAFLERACFRR